MDPSSLKCAISDRLPQQKFCIDEIRISDMRSEKHRIMRTCHHLTSNQLPDPYPIHLHRLRKSRSFVWCARPVSANREVQ